MSFGFHARGPQLGARCLCLLAAVLAAHSVSWAQGITVTGKVELVDSQAAPKIKPAGRNPADKPLTAVVWLTPLPGTQAPPMKTPVGSNLRLVQKNKSFQPHILIVPVGAAVEFPNRDPWFHNVFSLFEGKRFDLGLYEAGETRVVHFDREGISYIFCNIHPEMSAVVIALSTPYYAIAAREGGFSLPSVPAGRYVLHAWSEQASPEALQSTEREVSVSEQTRSVGTLRLAETTSTLAAHKNKYGKDYDQSSHTDYSTSPY